MLLMRQNIYQPGPVLRLVVYGLMLWLMFEFISNVYVTNQSAGLYPHEADSVSIPIYSMAFFLMLSTLPLTLLSILPQSRFLERLFRRSVGWRRFGDTLMVGLYGFGILFALGGGTELLTPDHRMIGVAHMPLLAQLLWTGWLDWRWLVALKSST
jgi:hypothetical protein